jgi:hypothetical protein
VGGRIVAGVGLSLDDPTSDLVNKQDGSDEFAGDRYRIAGEEGLRQRCCRAPVSVTS